MTLPLNRNVSHCHALILATVLITASGCGGAFDASVDGEVTLDGVPLNTGTVTFAPVSPGSAAFAKVDENGYYRLKTGREVGLPPGDYVVTVVARDKPASLYGENGGPPPAGKQITPEWYRSAESSGLAYTVEPGGNTIDLQLTTDPPADWKPKRRRRR